MQNRNWVYRLQFFLKRGIDILVSGLGMILLWPFFLIICLVIRLDSPGPVVYRHDRVGKEGKPFGLLKFRSMHVGGDDSGYMNYLQELIESSKNGQGKPYRKMEDDPRVTRFGRILRQYYLDELPQLWNILKGDMSLVGPRPHVQVEVDHYTPEQCRRLAVRPGATGLWQVDGKADCSFAELLELDLRYIDDWNLLLDFNIIWRTFKAMILGGEKAWSRMAKIVPRHANAHPAPACEEDAHPVMQEPIEE